MNVYPSMGVWCYRASVSIILVRVFNPEVGDVLRTIFLDMPVVNIVTATNLFDALLKRTMLMWGVVNVGVPNVNGSNVPILISKNLATMKRMCDMRYF